MPLQRFRSVEEVPDAPQVPLDERADRIAALWAFRPDRMDIPRGVMRFRSIEEAQSARKVFEADRARRLRDDK